MFKEKPKERKTMTEQSVHLRRLISHFLTDMRPGRKCCAQANLKAVNKSLRSLRAMHERYVPGHSKELHSRICSQGPEQFCPLTYGPVQFL